MNKFIYVISFMLIGMSVSCEKQDWFSPEDVDALKANYPNSIK